MTEYDRAANVRAKNVRRLNTTTETRDTLNDRVEFDSPFYSHGDGRISDARGVYAPEVSDDETHEPWTLLTGWTGQHGYNGATLHESEQLSGALAQHVLDTPGTYVVTTSMTSDHDSGCPEFASECACHFAAGWAIATIPAE